MNERRFKGSIERLRSAERVSRLEIDRVVDGSLEAIEAKTLLDVGTGSGLFAEAFAKRGVRVTGIDVSEEMLEAARHFVPTGDFHQAPMEKLPFPEGSFDVVFLGMVLHEADDLTEALREARRTALHRVVILEWPYETAQFGPPLEHRLTPLQIEKTVTELGYTSMELVRLQHLHLYRLGK
jgi:ubiquinone/menaquinone biosynthesis C-methylase UbiE